MDKQNTRRKFLKTTGTGLLFAPAASFIGCNSTKVTSGKNDMVRASGKSSNIVMNLKDFGATGDGQTKDTLTIQQTIDRCSVLGGGEVLIPCIQPIATGDDCISLKSGRGMEGYSILYTTEDVHLSNCTFADSIFACIGIGSETSGGIRDVRIEKCRFVQAKTFAVYIKSRPGRGAFIENITVDDIDVSGMAGGFLRLNIVASGLQDEFPVPGSEGIPTIKNFRFSNIRVNDVPVLVDGIGIHPDKPLDGFSLSNVSGTCAKGISLANIKNAKLGNITVSVKDGPLLGINNVTGSGLDKAVSIDGPKIQNSIQAPLESYRLH